LTRTIKMPSRETIKQNYSDSAGKAQTNYEAGVDGNTDQHERAFSDWAEAKYGTAVQKAAREKTRQKRGKEKSSQSEWKERSKTKGAPALGAAIPLSAEKMADGYEKIRAGLDGMTIPDKVADPYMNIDNILKAVVKKSRQLAGKE